VFLEVVPCNVLIKLSYIWGKFMRSNRDIIYLFIFKYSRKSQSNLDGGVEEATWLSPEGVFNVLDVILVVYKEEGGLEYDFLIVILVVIVFWDIWISSRYSSSSSLNPKEIYQTKSTSFSFVSTVS
jgi:hypothetical protein